ncbi:MAG: CinA family protein [Chloroflexota bacterium]|jgi:nicotinamide mononucleotide (NMN) deamidase PncC|nr:CinA family protein [Chloroflexota bacterium]MDP6508119.1 CinA family protein [Chloroflexota bacterium]MDP6757154.1 CinA family protein [Chloroflexota bacterium]
METLIRRLHDSPARLVIAVTGGGVGLLAALTSVPGASRTLLGAAVPYSAAALRRYIGGEPEGACSARTASDMALAALARASEFAPEADRDLLGVGITCGLATDRERRGENRCFVAVVGRGGELHRGLTLTKGARSRTEEERVASDLALATILRMAGIDGGPEPELLEGERVAATTPGVEYRMARLADGRLDRVALNGAGELVGGENPSALLAGSYNPLHAGHRALLAAAGHEVGVAVTAEISIENVDKPLLDAEEVLRRVGQFAADDRVFVTRAATFREKAWLFPGVTFVIGVDTAERLVAAQYYGDNEVEMRAALSEIRAAGCRFLVAGRVDGAGRFGTLADVAIPAEFAPLFGELPEARFRADVSSSEIRDA